MQSTTSASEISDSLMNLVRRLATVSSLDSHEYVVSELQTVKQSIEGFLAYAQRSRPKEINNSQVSKRRMGGGERVERERVGRE